MSRIPAIFVYLFLVVANTSVVSETLPDINLIAPEGKAVNFGVWKIHNEGFVITMLDQNNFRLLKIHGNSSVRVADADDTGFLLSSSGGNVPSNGFWYKRYSQETRDAETIGEIQNGRYQFKSAIFLVEGDEIKFFNMRDEDESPITPLNVLSKFNNGIVHSGREIATVIDPVSTIGQITGTSNFAKTAECLFQWAEKKYPALLSPASTDSIFWEDYIYRYYSDTNTYLGFFQEKNVHLLQQNISKNVEDVGLLEDYRTLAGCD